MKIGAMLFASLAIAACGASTATAPSTSSTPSPTVAPAFPSGTPAAAGLTLAQLTAVAAAVYPMCASGCPHGHYTTCEIGHSGASLYAGCPLTPRLAMQLQVDSSGIISAPDELGGGQDPFWDTESITAESTEAGGTAHVVLAQTGGTGTETFDLTVVESGSQLLVDDISCTGQDPSSTDAYSPGWAGRSTCSG